jgi:hypothetical protein
MTRPLEILKNVLTDDFTVTQTPDDNGRSEYHWSCGCVARGFAFESLYVSACMAHFRRLKSIEVREDDAQAGETAM